MKKVALTLVSTMLLLLSCGDSETSSMTFAEFKTKLESLQKPVEAKCPDCDGTGFLCWKPGDGPSAELVKKPHKPISDIPDMTDSSRKPGEMYKSECPICNGDGVVGGLASPTLQEVEAALGKPTKKQEISGTRYWYYSCKEGLIQIPVYLRGDRVIFGDPNLY